MGGTDRRRWVAAVVTGAFALAVGACGGGGEGRGAIAPRRGPTTTTASERRSDTTEAAQPAPSPPLPTTTLPPATTSTASAFGDPAVRPIAAGDPAGLADQLVRAERAVRDPATPPDQLRAAAHLQQVAYRQLGRHLEWDADVLARVPPELRDAVWLGTDARRQFASMYTRVPDTMPAWRIVEPEPADVLRGYYGEAEGAFGVGWEYLAAINLVETGMGRIRGTSVAGAQGPMQFMPATWEAYGEGDVNDPRDAIMAAARYLAANGFADGNVDGALFRYNRHPAYVAGVKDYARVLELDPAAYGGFHAWQVYYATVLGDVWLPTGYELAERVPVADWLAGNPQ